MSVLYAEIFVKVSNFKPGPADHPADPSIGGKKHVGNLLEGTDG